MEKRDKKTQMRENKIVLSLDLKESAEGAHLIVKGMLFHSLGAYTANVQSLLSFNLERRMARTPS